MDLLSSDLLALLFKYLEERAFILTCRLVCKCWNHVVEKHFALLVPDLMSLQRCKADLKKGQVIRQNVREGKFEQLFLENIPKNVFGMQLTPQQTMIFCHGIWIDSSLLFLHMGNGYCLFSVWKERDGQRAYKKLVSRSSEYHAFDSFHVVMNRYVFFRCNKEACLLDCKKPEVGDVVLGNIGDWSYSPVLSVSKSAIAVFNPNGTSPKFFCWRIDDSGKMDLLKEKEMVDRKKVYVVQNGDKYLKSCSGSLDVYSMETDERVSTITHESWENTDVLLVKRGFRDDDMYFVRVEFVHQHTQFAKPQGYLVSLKQNKVIHVFDNLGVSAFSKVRGAKLFVEFSCDALGQRWNFHPERNE